MTEPRFTLISVDGANSTQLTLIHEAIKDAATAWWHQQTGVWIVESQEDVGFWRDLVKPFLRGVAGTALVVNLPVRAANRGWATSNLSGRWLMSEYGPSSSKTRGISAEPKRATD